MAGATVRLIVRRSEADERVSQVSAWFGEQFKDVVGLLEQCCSFGGELISGVQDRDAGEALEDAGLPVEGVAVTSCGVCGALQVGVVQESGQGTEPVDGVGAVERGVDLGGQVEFSGGQEEGVGVEADRFRRQSFMLLALR